MGLPRLRAPPAARPPSPPLPAAPAAPSPPAGQRRGPGSRSDRPQRRGGTGRAGSAARAAAGEGSVALGPNLASGSLASGWEPREGPVERGSPEGHARSPLLLRVRVSRPAGPVPLLGMLPARPRLEAEHRFGARFSTGSSDSFQPCGRAERRQARDAPVSALGTRSLRSPPQKASVGEETEPTGEAAQPGTGGGGRVPESAEHVPSGTFPLLPRPPRRCPPASGVPRGPGVLLGVPALPMPPAAGCTGALPCAWKIPACSLFPLFPARWQAVAMDRAVRLSCGLPWAWGIDQRLCLRKGRCAQPSASPGEPARRSCSGDVSHLGLSLWTCRCRASPWAAGQLARGFRCPAVVCAGNLAGSSCEPPARGLPSPGRIPCTAPELAVTRESCTAPRSSWGRILPCGHGSGCLPCGHGPQVAPGFPQLPAVYLRVPWVYLQEPM